MNILYLNFIELDILLNVFLAIAVDNLADADSLTSIEKEDEEDEEAEVYNKSRSLTPNSFENEEEEEVYEKQYNGEYEGEHEENGSETKLSGGGEEEEVFEEDTHGMNIFI